MKFIRANHVLDTDNTLVTFGIDESGKVWIVTNADGSAEGIETEYFGFSAQTFWELAHSLISLAVAAIRVKLTGSMFPPMDDESNPYPHIHEDDGTVEGCPGCFGPESAITRIEPGTWHGTEIGPHGVVIHTDAVSAYPPVPRLRKLGEKEDD